MYKKAGCTCKIVVLLINPIVFVAFPLPSPSSDLKVPNLIYIVQRRAFVRGKDEEHPKNLTSHLFAQRFYLNSTYCEQFYESIQSRQEKYLSS